MRKTFILLLCCPFLFVNCGSNRKTLVKSRNTPVVSLDEKTSSNTQLGAVKPATIVVPKQIDRVKKDAMFPMPEDKGSFIKFDIETTEEYIQKFKDIAQYEMRAFGIPASITLAQGILESGSGKGQLTKKTNNHFGIKCHQEWQGDFDLHDDDAKGECFRKYNHPMYSFRDHSVFLASRARYQFLFNYKRDDYKRWAYGLKRAGYATDSKYPQKLITLIDKYQLHQYDVEVMKEGLEIVRQPKQYEVFTHRVEQGDTLYGLSKKYAISVEEIKRLNHLKNNQLSIGQFLNLRRVVSGSK